MLIAFDWKRKVIRFGPSLTPTGEVAEQLAWIQAQFAGIAGKR